MFRCFSLSILVAVQGKRRRDTLHIKPYIIRNDKEFGYKALNNKESIQRVLIIHCFYKQTALIIWCFICKESLLFGALYTKSPYCLVLYMQTALIVWCFICKLPLLFGALYAKSPYYLVLYTVHVGRRQAGAALREEKLASAKLKDVKPQD